MICLMNAPSARRWWTMDDVVPEEPSADARTLARVFRDFYVAFIAEGFNETQALKMLGVMLSSAREEGKSDGD